MKRDELLKTIRALECVEDHEYDNECGRRNAIAWLERLPAGCELVGRVEVSDCPHHGVHYINVVTDDLTKAGKR